jgi:hypothetical protein
LQAKPLELKSVRWRSAKGRYSSVYLPRPPKKKKKTRESNTAKRTAITRGKREKEKNLEHEKEREKIER